MTQAQTAILVSEKTNGARDMIEMSVPYVATVEIEGVSDFLFHRWNAEAVDEKAKTAKGSRAKKTDDVETYVYRLPNNDLAIPGEYLRMSVINAAKFRQDPRSPRKSAMDLFKAGVIPLTLYASLGTAQWDYLDKRRVTVQRAGINRTRPALRAGWRATFDLQVNLPEYIDPNMLRETIEAAGRLVGVGDFRPTFGRFGVVGFESR
jgi:hypothetical protein